MDYNQYSLREIKLIKRLVSVSLIYGIDCSHLLATLDVPYRAVVRRYVYLVLPKISQDLYDIALRDAQMGLSADDSFDRVGRATLSKMIKDLCNLL